MISFKLYLVMQVKSPYFRFRELFDDPEADE